MSDHRRSGWREGEVLLEGASRGDNRVVFNAEGVEREGGPRVIGRRLGDTGWGRVVERVLLELGIRIKLICCIPVAAHSRNMRREVGWTFPILKKQGPRSDRIIKNIIAQATGSSSLVGVAANI